MGFVYLKMSSIEEFLKVYGFTRNRTEVPVIEDSKIFDNKIIIEEGRDADFVQYDFTSPVVLLVTLILSEIKEDSCNAEMRLSIESGTLSDGEKEVNLHDVVSDYQWFGEDNIQYSELIEFVDDNIIDYVTDVVTDNVSHEDEDDDSDVYWY